MTGPGHYREAERLLDLTRTNDRTPEDPLLYAEAQVHATLALAAAMVDGPSVMRPEDRDDWDRATGRAS